MTRSSSSRYGTDRDAVLYHCPYPMRVHGNPFHVQWEDAIATCLADDELRGRYPSIADVTVLTYNNHAEPGLLERCLEHLGFGELVVLGKHVVEWNWRHKISLVDDYLRTGECATPYVLCLDGDDVIMVGDPGVLVERFLQTGSEILFCGTRGNQPPSPECWEFENGLGGDPQHRHLNAGCYFGRTPYVAARLAEISAAIDAGEQWCFYDGKVDDQLAWRQLHRRCHPEIQVDVDCQLFLRFDEDR